MGAVVLDTSVVIGFLNTDDAHHKAATVAISEHRDALHRFVLPATVLAEALVSAARRDPDSVAEVRGLIDSLFGPTRAVDESVAVEAARVRAKHRSVQLPDAVVIATGVVDGATQILTADRRLGRVEGRVRVL